MVCEAFAFAFAFPEVFEAHVVPPLEVDDGGSQDRRQKELEAVHLKKKKGENSPSGHGPQ